MSNCGQFGAGPFCKGHQYVNETVISTLAQSVSAGIISPNKLSTMVYGVSGKINLNSVKLNNSSTSKKVFIFKTNKTRIRTLIFKIGKLTKSIFEIEVLNFKDKKWFILRYNT